MNILKKLFLGILVVLNSSLFAIDEPRLDLILSIPKVYNYVSDGSNMTLTATNGGNGVLQAKLEESYYDNELNTTMYGVFNYDMSWNGRGYEGGDSKSNWVMVDTYYQGVRVIGTMNKMKRDIVLDLKNKTIKFKSYGLFKVEAVGYSTSYYRMINDNESEISSSSYNNYLSSFDSYYNSISLASDTATPTNIKNQIFNDLLYNYSPTANAGVDQTVTYGNSVQLDSSLSEDLDGTINSYVWKEGTNVLSTSKSFLKSDFSVGTHFITLTVTDNDGATASDTIVITVHDTYSWQMANWGECFGSCGTNQAIQTRSVQCINSLNNLVNDSYCTTSKPNTTQSCTRGCIAPTADAGVDINTNKGDTITLDAIGSSDSDGSISSYSWSENGNILATTSQFTKSDFSVGVHTIILQVTDNDGLSDSDTVVVTISIIDNDNDGIPDEYENTNGLDPLVNDSGLDLDNDGKTNLEEYQAGTKANDPNSKMFKLDLKEGWNLVSLELNSSVDLNTLNNIHIEAVRSLKDDKWNTWTKDNLNNPDQYFNILEDGYGYWIKASQDTLIDIKGNGLSDSKTITPNRWNMVGSQEITDISQFFTDNPDVKIIWKYKDGKYHVISKDNTIDSDLSPLENNGDLIELQTIEKNEGFFVK